MKNRFFISLLAATTILLAACNKAENDEIDPGTETEKDYPTLSAVSGSYVIAIKFEGEVCNDIVFTGTFNSWSTTVSTLPRMKPLDETNWPGWYTITVPATGNTMQAKPVQLDNEGKFSWDYQTGSKSSWTVKAGSVSIASSGISGEADLTFSNPETPICMVSSGWKNNNSPCSVVIETLQFNVTVPENVLEPGDVVYIVGDIDDWAITPMKKVDDTHWTWSKTGVFEAGVNYMYLLNGDWDYEELAAKADGAECAEGISYRVMTTAIMDDTVENFNGRAGVTKCD